MGKRGGGFRQRQARSSRAHTHNSSGATTAGTIGQCFLTTYLIDRWSWGWMSPQVIQTIASNAKKDIDAVVRGESIDMGSLNNLASLGNHGRNPNNCHRDLVSQLHGANISQPTTANMVEGCGETIFYPHAVFSDIYNNYNTAFSEKVCPDRDTLESFWCDMEESPQLRNHPVRSVPNWRRRAIPLSLHGDGVPITGVGKSWSQRTDIFSWCSLFGTGLTRTFNYYIWGVFKQSSAAGKLKK